ncbi:MAG: protein kinase domain-containing protein [Anaerolineales bacterium]
MTSIQFLIGKTLGKYQVVEHLGHGGMAEVYMGQQVKLDRRVAIKVLHPFLAEDEGFVTRFQREARIVATLRHPNIVQVYDFDHNEEYDIYYMVMEFIDGPTLKEIMAEAPFAPSKVGDIGAAVADALGYAHRRDMVHRDIKPANIMFTEDGEPVLTDFGIARMMSLSGLTASGAMVGTPAYMAPEIATGQSASAASDIYSLGVVLYEMATGRQPFEAEIPMGLVMKHINDPVPPPSQFVNLPPQFEDIILKSLEKRPSARQGTAAEMASELRQAVGLDTPSYGMDTSPPPIGSGTRPSRRQQEVEEPLLRTWTGIQGVPDRAQTRSRRRARPLVRLLRTVFLTIFLVVAGLGAWTALGNSLPPAVEQFYQDVRAFASADEATVTPTLAPTQTPSPTPTETVLEASPPLTPTPDTCAYRAEVLRVYRTPAEEEVAPETTLIAYVTLRNGGNCSWPPGVRLAFVRGRQMNDLNTIDLEPLQLTEQMQVLLPLYAPGEAGTYESVWEVQLPGGRSISGEIVLTVEVDAEAAVTTPTPTPEPESTATPLPAERLTLVEPELLTWSLDEERDLWTGELGIEATGGSGEYRFYRESIRADTEIEDGTLEFTWEACRDLPLRIIVTSGEEVEVWQGLIPFPDPEACAP